MDFAFNPEQQLLRQTLADFAARELAPHYMARDQDADLPREIVRKLGSWDFVPRWSRPITAARPWITLHLG